MTLLDEKDLLPIPRLKDPETPPANVWNTFYALIYKDILAGLKRRDIIHKYQHEILRNTISKMYVKACSQIKTLQIAESVNQEILEHVAPILKENAMLAASAANQALTALNASSAKIKELSPADISALSKVSKEQLELSKLEKGEATKIVQIEHLKTIRNNKIWKN